MQFIYDTAVQRIIFGAGSRQLLPQLVDDFGWQRVLLCTSPHLQANGTAVQIAALLEGKVKALFAGTAAHVPYDQVTAVASLAQQNRCDVLIGLGGGSAIGLAKAVSFELASGHAERQGLVPIPTIAIPTTYAGSEMTPVFGVTYQQEDGTTRKVTERGPAITPRAALYDPGLTLDLPPRLSAASGVNALAHCIEAIYSVTRNSLSTAAALRGITAITKSLPTCVAEGSNLSARSEMLEGAHLAGAALATVSMGLHHGTGHVLGGTAGVAHGVANCIALPHAMRFNAGAAPQQLAIVAEAMGVQRNGRTDGAMALAAADAAEALIRQLDMPQQLRQVGVEESLLPQLAKNLLLSKAAQSNPKPLTSEKEALAYLAEMW